MNKFTIFAGLGTLAVAGVALAQTATTPAAPDRNAPSRNADVTRQQVIERADARFARLDTDNDGRATAEEARAASEQRRAEFAGRMFDRMDANRDGSVTRAEFDQARERMHERRGDGAGEGMGMRRGGPRGHGMRGLHGRHGAGLFGEQGFVTREQLRERALARFDRMDANRDGTLTAAERQQARAAHRAERRERRGQAD